VAAHQKKAHRNHATLIFIDESGLLMAPLVRRTWAPRGETPILRQRGKHREKVSVAAALCLSPHHLRLVFRTLVNDYFNNHRSAGFLDLLMREIPGCMVVIWDGGSMHKGDPIRERVQRFAPRLQLERLPPYAPMLNPVEPIWSWLKYERLSNFAPQDAQQLRKAVVGELTAIDQDPEILRNFWHASDLPFPRHYFCESL
jgi:transposase